MATDENWKHAAKELLSSKFSKWKQMSFPGREEAEQATPETVAEYRAKRKTGKTAVDLCCGIGMDAIALSRSFGKVYAFDRDPETIGCAKENAKAYGAENIEFACADFRESGLGKINPDLVFADPARRVGVARVKALNETEPDTLAIIDFMRSAGAKDFCVEVSHALKPDELPDGCEKEFITVEGKPNCITLYFGGLKRAEYSAVDLPSGKRVEAQACGEKIDEKKLQLRYLHELNEGIVWFGLQKQVHDSLGKTKENVFPFGQGFFGSTQKVFSPFFVNSFKVRGETGSVGGLAEKLKKLKAGKVVLRGKFMEKDHLELKKSIEEKLEGKRKVHAFFFGEKIIIAENLRFR